MKVTVWPRKRHLTAGIGAARAGNAIEKKAEKKPKPSIRLEISFTS